MQVHIIYYLPNIDIGEKLAAIGTLAHISLNIVYEVVVQSDAASIADTYSCVGDYIIYYYGLQLITKQFQINLQHLIGIIHIAI